jgi:hypothetical protein
MDRINDLPHSAAEMEVALDRWFSTIPYYRASYLGSQSALCVFIDCSSFLGPRASGYIVLRSICGIVLCLSVHANHHSSAVRSRAVALDATGATCICSRMHFVYSVCLQDPSALGRCIEAARACIRVADIQRHRRPSNPLIFSQVGRSSPTLSFATHL